jgi:hypothetical protein
MAGVLVGEDLGLVSAIYLFAKEVALCLATLLPLLWSLSSYNTLNESASREAVSCSGGEEAAGLFVVLSSKVRLDSE